MPEPSVGAAQTLPFLLAASATHCRPCETLPSCQSALGTRASLLQPEHAGTGRAAQVKAQVPSGLKLVLPATQESVRSTEARDGGRWAPLCLRLRLSRVRRGRAQSACPGGRPWLMNPVRKLGVSYPQLAYSW